MSDLSELLTVTYLSWETWAIRSQLLICLERSERIAHSRSFDLSEMSEWAMSKWANSQPWFHGSHPHVLCTVLCWMTIISLLYNVSGQPSPCSTMTIQLRAVWSSLMAAAVEMQIGLNPSCSVTKCKYSKIYNYNRNWFDSVVQRYQE